MKISVRICGHLQHDAPGKRAEHTLTLKPGATLLDAIEELGIPRAEVAMRLVNDQHVKNDHPLSDGDELALVPVIAGG